MRTRVRASELNWQSLEELHQAGLLHTRVQPNSIRVIASSDVEQEV